MLWQITKEEAEYLFAALLTRWNDEVDPHSLDLNEQLRISLQVTMARASRPANSGTVSSPSQQDEST